MRHVVRWSAHRVAGDVGATVAVLCIGTLPTALDGVPALSGGPAVAEVVVWNAVAALVLLARHRAALVVLGAQVVLLVAGLPLGLLSHGTVVATTIAVYTVTLRVPRARSIPATLLVALVMLWLTSVSGYGGPQPALIVLLAGAIGDAIRSQRASVAAATERAERAERTREALARERVTAERLDIARDLHDVVAHQIAVINLHAGVAGSALRDRPGDAEASLEVIGRASRTVLTEIGDMLSALRDPATGATDSGPLGLAELDDVVRRFAVVGLEVTVRMNGARYELPGSTDITALRVIAEALTNAHKHGADGRAHVLVEYGPRSLRLTVANPLSATGRAQADADEEPGGVLGTSHGLIGMQERVDSVRGTLRYGPSGVGTWLLVADLPTDPAGLGRTSVGSGR